MTPITLSPEQHRALWASIATIRAAMGDLMLVADAYRIIGLGDLCRRVEDDRTKANLAATEIARLLQEAAGHLRADEANERVFGSRISQTEQRV